MGPDNDLIPTASGIAPNQRGPDIVPFLMRNGIVPVPLSPYIATVTQDTVSPAPCDKNCSCIPCMGLVSLALLGMVLPLFLWGMVLPSPPSDPFKSLYCFFVPPISACYALSSLYVLVMPFVLPICPGNAFCPPFTYW